MGIGGSQGDIREGLGGNGGGGRGGEDREGVL